ncbi:hypothetical protein CEXT_297601 [Caerostris extrusa]|uniref:Ribosomal protein L2 n=1 Tax=Caerostris extrusa TaxID=172846 RepID=A0AAV4T822_CAEEX|nr:hypothetical protein CEXT_297601 [Caerostris extrusa]
MTIKGRLHISRICDGSKYHGSGKKWPPFPRLRVAGPRHRWEQKFHRIIPLRGAQPDRMASDFGRIESLDSVEVPFAVFRSESFDNLSFLLLCSELGTLNLFTSNLLYIHTWQR